VSPYLIDAMSQALQLLYSPPRLFVWIITGSYCSHACWFITRIALCAVVEIRIRAAGAVSEQMRISNGREIISRMRIHANVPCHGNMGTSMRFTHHRNNGNLWSFRRRFFSEDQDTYSTSSSNRSSLEFW